MIYLDYSATTKADTKVLNKFTETEEKYFANPNSNHKLGKEALNEIKEARKSIANLLNIKENELIFTSGASESNNMVLKGLNMSHIITTKLEHSSITTPLGFLQTKNVKIDFVNLEESGLIDINHLLSLIDDNTKTLISIGAVNSETGLRQPIEEIGKKLKKYPNVIFHSDITQALGKCSFDLTNIDVASFSMHKIFGIKGIGGLIKKENIKLIPLIHGGKSLSIYRSGTPQTSLITSSSIAIKEAFTNLEEKYKYVDELNQYLKTNIKDLVTINSNSYSIPHILNISVLNYKPETFLHYLEMSHIYISTQSACSTNDYSKSVYALTNDKELAKTSVRISLSYKTTKEELNKLIRCIKRSQNGN